MKAYMTGTDDTVRAIDETLAQIQMLNDDAKKRSFLKKLGEAVKVRVEQAINQCRRTESGSYKEYHTHIHDDVTYKVKNKKSTGMYVSVSGGKSTWRLWHLVNDGHVQNGTYTAGNKFVDRAVTLSEDDVNQLFDEFIGAAIK